MINQCPTCLGTGRVQIPTTLEEAIKLRESVGLSQKQLAELAHYHPHSISDIETGRVKFSQAHALAYTQAVFMKFDIRRNRTNAID